MKKGQVIKNASVNREELALINSYSRREMQEDEVYVFSVVLCDNDIDRDSERFPVESLYELEKLFVGKTGLTNHDPKAENQTARIISCQVESVNGKKNSLGDDYFRLVARAYMPSCDRNKDMILAIDSGIVKEVSVGCAVEETRCSICGEPIDRCNHIKGESYNGRLCFGELINPYDAYEWSFVAVPAQKNAGVIKAYGGNEKTMTEILKSLDKGEALNLTRQDSKKLCKYIDSLKKQAADGAAYRRNLVTDVLKYSAIVQPDISSSTMESITGGLTIDELLEVRKAYMSKAEDYVPVRPQLYIDKSKDSQTKANTEYRI